MLSLEAPEDSQGAHGARAARGASVDPGDGVGVVNAQQDMFACQQGCDERHEEHGSDQLGLGDDELGVVGVVERQGERDVEPRAEREDPHALLARGVRGEEVPGHRHWRGDGFDAVPRVCEQTPPLEVVAEAVAQMGPVVLALEGPQGVEKLAHESAPSRDDGANKCHLARQAF